MTEQRPDSVLHFEIPSSLADQRNGRQWPPTGEDSDAYQLDPEVHSVVGMLEQIRSEMPHRIVAAKHRLEQSPLADIAERPYFSITSFEKPRKLFTPETGALRLNHRPVLPAESALSAYYSVAGRDYITDRGQWQNRGRRYYVALDREQSDPSRKVSVIREDIRGAQHVLMHTDRRSIQSKDEFIAYAGVTDTLKQHALTMFHALTFPERSADFAFTEDYEEIREKAFAFARDMTRYHYQVLFGTEQDEDFDPTTITARFNDVATYLLSTDTEVFQFKNLEIDHPMIIALGAHETAVRHQGVEDIVVMPSGGTQIGIATQMMYEGFHGVDQKRYPDASPHLIWIPLSLHSAGKYYERGSLEHEEIVRRLSNEGIADHRVLLIDDNANEGQTLSAMAKALHEAGAHQVIATIVEMDPGRVISKQFRVNGDRPSHVFNMTHPDLAAISIVPTFRIGGDVLQQRKIIAQKIADGKY